jgi:hypothetical protein
MDACVYMFKDRESALQLTAMILSGLRIIVITPYMLGIQTGSQESLFIKICL